MRISLFVFILFVSTAPVFAQMPTAGLAAWYPFNGTATDTTGHNNNGTVNGAVPVNDRFGNANKAYYFNGSNASISGNTLTYPIGDNPRTISLWFTAKNYPGISEPFALAAYGSLNQICGNIFGAVLWPQPSASVKQIGTWQGCAGNSPDRKVTRSYSLNTWYHLAVTYDSGFQRIYLNDTLIDTATVGPLNTQNETFSFGKATGNMYYHYGNLDDIAIYNRALSRCEIHKLYDTTIAFSQHPQSVTAQPASDTIFVVQSPVANRQIQWQVNSGSGFVNLTNSTPYSGVNTDTLHITTITETMNNNLYRAVLTYPGLPCTETSGTALLSVIPSQVSIITKPNLSIYPNPFTSDIYVKWTGPMLNRGRLRITDVTGRQVYEQNSFVGNETSVSGASLAPGFYTIGIYEGETLLITQKVTKQ